MVKRKLTVGGLIGYLASVSHYHKYVKLNSEKPVYVLVFPTCNFFTECYPRFSVAPFQNRPNESASLHFPNKTI
jgi:hypothetical protein